MERVVTGHLKDIGAFLEPNFEKPEFNERTFAVKTSVIIPVKNRIKTIEDAVKSVLMQKTNFKFNLIVVDNHSTDGTSEILEFLSETDNRLVHHVPSRTDLGIGGCWNEGVHHETCGMFAIQLDSDDIYKDENTIQKIVDAFYEQQCAMVVGTYQLVNFKLEEIPPGIIDHKEWTPENGRNNALRINGFGAPRAFYTPILREIKIPNVSYGEDYAVGLAVSRHYQIGRIYENLYLCRRWDDNSDAALDIEKMNKHNLYKDRVRTIELKARQNLNNTK
jgi:glycosyltransferase involved in cell wall biosynthesis